jgi:hypothetical protein
VINWRTIKCIVGISYSSSFDLRTQVESKDGEPMFLVSINLLQDSIDKDPMHFNQGDYMFIVEEDMLQIYTCGHILSHNIVHSHFLATSFVFELCKIDFKQNRRRGWLFVKKGRVMRT